MQFISRLIVLLGLAMLLLACSQTATQIGSSPLLCCPGGYESYSEYSLETENLPIFLRDYVVAEFERAFDSKGLSRNDQFHDVEVVLRYNHINLYPDQQDIDPFVRIESLSVELSYVAQIVVEVFETATGDKVWAGAISRIHQVTPGEYMHESRASPAFYDAFVRMLENYPERTHKNSEGHMGGDAGHSLLCASKFPFVCVPPIAQSVAELP